VAARVPTTDGSTITVGEIITRGLDAQRPITEVDPLGAQFVPIAKISKKFYANLRTTISAGTPDRKVPTAFCQTLCPRRKNQVLKPEDSRPEDRIGVVRARESRLLYRNVPVLRQGYMH
jgi:hypothetical protein